MPAHTLLPCPCCRLVRVVETERTYPSPPILPTAENPTPVPPHLERDRYCVWCGARWETTEKLVRVTQPGDPERVEQAHAAAAGSSDAPPVALDLVDGSPERVSRAHEVLCGRQRPLRWRDLPGQKRLFESEVANE